MKFLSHQKNNKKSALNFLLKLLILLSLLKCIFFFYNYTVASGWKIESISIFFSIITWSFLYDILWIAIINVPFFLLLIVFKRFLKKSFFFNPIAILFSIANSFLILLNIIDVFYFRFHQQRADADLLYVLKNPFSNHDFIAILIGVTLIFLLVVITYFVFISYKRIRNSSSSNKPFLLTAILISIFFTFIFWGNSNRFLPTYPLTAVSAKQLPLTQNSLQTFIYSLYRKNESQLYPANYMSKTLQQNLFTNIKTADTTVANKKNVVLFIMESIPAVFFDTASKYKVEMPFFDSLIDRSTYFENAYSYGHHSNQGITSILTGIPTIIDIPLYHSNFTGIPITQIGNTLKNNGYTSSFFIGDNYDDFGFAQCCNWLGLKY
jgi:hypothetical protein